MRLAILVVALPFLLALPRTGAAKGETARIEISKGKRPFLTLAGEESAGQFTIWSGPGTSSAGTVGERDIADWSAGAVEPPRNLQVYKVRFYCARSARRRAKRCRAACVTACVTASTATAGRVTSRFRRSTTGTSPTTPALSTAASKGGGSVRRRAGKNGFDRSSTRRWPRRRGTRTTYERPYIYAPPSPSHTAVGAKPSIPTRPR